MKVEFRVLGPIEASRGSEALQLGGAKQRVLLAILLLNASEVVSSDRLIDELWGQAAPETAAKALQVHVSQLRKALEPEREAGEPPRFLVAAERSASLLTEALEEYRTLGMEPWERRAERALDEAGVRQRASR